jgi:maltose/moltooligosaccharide transporter
MVGVGIAWSSILALPYAMLVGSLPDDRGGLYMGIFNFFIVLPEVFVSLGLGWVMHHFLDNNRLYAVVMGGVFLIVAAIAALRLEIVPMSDPQASVIDGNTNLAAEAAVDNLDDLEQEPQSIA